MKTVIQLLVVRFHRNRFDEHSNKFNNRDGFEIVYQDSHTGQQQDITCPAHFYPFLRNLLEEGQPVSHRQMTDIWEKIAEASRNQQKSAVGLSSPALFTHQNEYNRLYEVYVEFHPDEGYGDKLLNMFFEYERYHEDYKNRGSFKAHLEFEDGDTVHLEAKTADELISQLRSRFRMEIGERLLEQIKSLSTAVSCGPYLYEVIAPRPGCPDN